MPKNFGCMLKKIREKRGLTQGDLASKTGITQAYISQLERGVKEKPTLDVVIMLANALNCDISELYLNQHFKKVENINQ